MKRNFKWGSRVLSAFLALALVIGMLPMSAMASEETYGKVEGKVAEKVNATDLTSLEDGEYIIVSGEKALDLTEVKVTETDGNSGFAGRDVTVADGKITSDIYEDMIWKVSYVATSEGYCIESVTENTKYLVGLREQDENGKFIGTLSLGSSQTKWTITDDGKLLQDDPAGRIALTYYNDRMFTMGNEDSAVNVELYKVEAAPVAVTGVTLDKEEETLTVGDTLKLEATVAPTDAANKNVKWSVNDDGKAFVEVAADGTVTALAEGTATVTVTTEDGEFTDSCTVTVEKASVPVESVTIEEGKDASLKVGESAKLTAKVLPEDAENKKVTWTVGNEELKKDETAEAEETDEVVHVVTVSEDGVVTATAEGTATVVATTEDGGFTAECTVTVEGYAVTELTLDQSTLDLKIGKTGTLSVTEIGPEEAEDKTVTWASSDEKVATVTVAEDGTVTVTAVAEGTATITAKAGVAEATCTVTVTPVKVTGVTLNKTETTLQVDGTETLVATVTPEDATNKDLIWTSSYESVAEVDDDGKITAYKTGDTVITVTTKDGRYKAECVVTVVDKVIDVTSVSIDKNSAELVVGETTTLKATVKPNNATNAVVTWTTDAPEVATVTDGVVTGVGEGTATITAEAGGKTATVTVTVKTVAVTGVTLDKTELEMALNGAITLTATVTPENATNKNVTWTTSNSKVASVNAAGKVTALKKGSAVITVTTEDGAFTATCTVDVKTEVCPHENLTEVAAVAADCVNAGNNAYYTCDNCGVAFKTDGVTKTTVEAETIAPLGHDWEVVEETDKTISYKCKREGCGATQVVNKDRAVRVYGVTRYDTSFAIAEALKQELGVEKFNVIVIANGDSFADALSGSYLAAVKNAPIILTNNKNVSDVTAYVSNNLAAGGKVYLLGGKYAVSENTENALKNTGCEVVRVAGTTRYDTNLAILKEAGVTSESAILVSTGTNFADSLSASGTKKPILLVDKKLSTAQKNFLAECSGKTFYILGGEYAVSKAMEAEIAKVGTVERVAGTTRYDTSVAIAKKFFTNPESAVFAYGMNYPDGLCGGPLAVAMKAPLILTETDVTTQAAKYVADCGIIKGAILGGNLNISDSAIRTILDLEETDTIKEIKWAK